MGTTFVNLYDGNGLGFLVQDTSTTSATDRKKAVNDAYVQLASIRGWWRRRAYDYTASASIPISANQYQVNLPPDCDTAFRLYYLLAGHPRQVDLVSDGDWLEQAQIASQSAGFPARARLTHNGTTQQLELSPRISAAFLSQIGTLTLEYFAVVSRLSSDSDEPLLPENYRHYIKYLAAKLYAIGQGDDALMRRLEQGGVLNQVARGESELRRQDVTRTGATRGLRPRTSYQASSIAGGGNDYGES